MTTSEQMKAVYKALSEKQGRDITVIDISDISTLADYFIITHGNNTPHVESLVECAQEALDKVGAVCKSVEGLRGGRWVLLDYGDIVVNVFSKEDRLWYDLERIWRDGKIVDMSAEGTAAADE
ncbi:MAG: ribosome silencing factor [Lachnospiraceae bacterium]|nr:ribosome silencing factor [Lachnospiraceae bacterium]